MKRVSSVSSVCQEINSYVERFDGAPLLVGLDSRRDYILVRNAMEDDPDKQILRLSDACNSDFPPNPTFEINNVRRAAQQGTVVWLGAGQSIMLYGRKHAEEFFINLGMTPTQYINEIRIEKAASKIRHSDMTLDEIALITGFSSTSYFREVFKAHTGITPAQYRTNLATEKG